MLPLWAQSLISFIGGLAGKLAFPILAFIAGKRSAERKHAERVIEDTKDGLEKLTKLATDPAEHERVRNKRKQRAGNK